MVKEIAQELEAATAGRIRFNEPMRLHTTFHVGGPAEVWAEPQDAAQLCRLLEVARDAELPVTAVGGGANLLVRDEGIPGLVIHLAGAGFQRFQATPEGIAVGAALSLDGLIRKAQEAGLSGVEFLTGVPGHVGGAVRMNAGTHDEQGNLHHFGDVIRSIQVMEPGGRLRTLQKEEIGFEYRSSRIDGIVLEALLELVPASQEEIAARVEKLWAFKRKTQDWSAPSVGCIFKNPKGLGPDGKHLPAAGWLVDQAGMKGHRIGGAMISTRHANFMVNVEQASASDVLSLIEEARERVRRKFGIKLELEVRLLP